MQLTSCKVEDHFRFFNILRKHFSRDNVAMYKITSYDVNNIREYVVSVIQVEYLELYQIFMMELHHRCLKGFYVSLWACFEIFNDAHREKLFYSIQYKNGWSAASDLFHMFTESIKFYTFYYHTLKSTNVWKESFIK